MLKTIHLAPIISMFSKILREALQFVERLYKILTAIPNFQPSTVEIGYEIRGCVKEV